MRQNQKILFSCEASIIFSRNDGKKTVETGIINKKIIITTQKLYVFKPITGEGGDDYQYKSSLNKKTKKKQEVIEGTDIKVPELTSITGQAENEIQLRDKQPKIIIDEQPSLLQYLAKQKIFEKKRSVKNSVLLIQHSFKQIELVFLDKIKEAFRFSKAVICCNVWIRYSQYCKTNNIKINERWVQILQKVIYEEDAVVVINPYHFNDDDQQSEISSFVYLLDIASYIYKLQLKFKIQSPFGYYCANKFLSSQSLINLRSLILTQCNIVDAGIAEIQNSIMRLLGIREIDLSKNRLTEYVFDFFSRLNMQCTQLSHYNLNNNIIEIKKQEIFINFLRSAQQFMNIDMSYNSIDDNSVKILQKFVIYAQYCPIVEINLSYNKFTRYGSWRLFVGNLRMIQNHAHMNFILYPVPFHVDIFNQTLTQYPVKKNRKVANSLPHNLSQEIGETSSRSSSMYINNHTLQGIIIKKKISSGRNLPLNGNQVNAVNMIKSRLQQLIKNKQIPLQEFRRISKEIESKPYGFPSTALQQYLTFILQKFNEALLIRDHQSVQILKDIAKMISLDISPYKQRIDKIQKRKQIYLRKLRSIFNFEIGEYEINQELDQMVKEGLRLNLRGPGMYILLYLKYIRDMKIQEFLKKKLNPLVEKQQLKTQHYVSLFDTNVEVSSQSIPVELRNQKDINENLYLNYLQVNYYLLYLIQENEYKRVLTILRTIKIMHQKFIKYFKLAEERINFILNEFSNNFLFNNFKISYSELKINSCRMLWQYRNIDKTILFFNMPKFAKKKRVTPERLIKIYNKKQFMNKYSVLNYPNIRSQARAKGIYEWKNIITKYSNPEFQKEAQQLLIHLEQFKQSLYQLTFKINQTIIPPLIKLIQYIRSCVFPIEINQELYLQLMFIKQNRDKNIENLLKIMPFLTFYLRPPETIQNYLMAFLAKYQFNFSYMPLSVTFLNNNDGTQFVDRDWIPQQKHALNLINTFGKINVPLCMMNKSKFEISINESQTIEKLMEQIYMHNELSPFLDKFAFWIYLYNSQTKIQKALQFEDTVGQLMAQFDQQVDVLYIKRRIYSPFFVFNYRLYNKDIIDSIYYDIKQYYLRGYVYRCYQHELEIASIIGFIDIFDQNKNVNDGAQKLKIYMDNLDVYLNTILPEYFLQNKNKKQIVKNIKSRLNERSIKEEEKNIMLLKKKFIEKFRDQPYYCSSNYVLRNDKQNRDCILSINSLYMCIQNDTIIEYIFLQSLITFIIGENRFHISYHNKQRLQVSELTFITRQGQSIQIGMDLLSYCIIRLKTPNNFLYLQRELLGQLQKFEIPLSMLDYQSNLNIQFLLKKLTAFKPQLNYTTLNSFVVDIEKILKRLEKLELLITRQKDYPFQNKNLYIKIYKNREIYPFKSNKKLDMIVQKTKKLIKKSEDIIDQQQQQGQPVQNSQQQIPSQSQNNNNTSSANDILGLIFGGKPKQPQQDQTAQKKAKDIELLPTNSNLTSQKPVNQEPQQQAIIIKKNKTTGSKLAQKPRRRQN